MLMQRLRGLGRGSVKITIEFSQVSASHVEKTIKFYSRNRPAKRKTSRLVEKKEKKHGRDGSNETHKRTGNKKEEVD